MNFHCLGQLFCVGSVPCYLLREQNNLKGESLPDKYFRPTKILPGNALRILPLVCHKSWILFPGTLILLGSWSVPSRILAKDLERTTWVGHSCILVAGWATTKGKCKGKGRVPVQKWSVQDGYRRTLSQEWPLSAGGRFHSTGSRSPPCLLNVSL